jgi:ABC-type amino acid transport system permease subunit
MTVGLIIVTAALGTVLSIAGAAARRGRSLVLRNAVGAYVELIRNTPFLVQIFFIFFGPAGDRIAAGQRGGGDHCDDDQSVRVWDRNRSLRAGRGRLILMARIDPRNWDCAATGRSSR